MENKYRQTYLDLTSKCNIACDWCINTKHSMNDITLEKVEEVCASLPKRVEMRLVGGEPTIHPQIVDIIKIIKKHGHIPSVISNGIKFADKQFCLNIKKLGYVLISLSIHMAVNPFWETIRERL
jgi:MoaA/NifB/PqqE/SkfB family radical SAM enzyme